MIKDNYGRPDTSMHYGMPRPTWCEIEDAGSGITYLRGSMKDPCLIRRITESGSSIKIEAATGNWSDRASLSYQAENDDNLRR